MDFLSLYIALQGMLIVICLVLVCYLIKEFLIPRINKKIEDEAKEIVYKKDNSSELSYTVKTDKEIIYYYDNGDEYHELLRRK